MSEMGRSVQGSLLEGVTWALSWAEPWAGESEGAQGI